MRYLFIILLVTVAAFAQCGDSDWWCTPYTAPAFPDDSLILYYNMDSLTASFEYYDFSGRGNHGTNYSVADTVGYGPGCTAPRGGYFDNTAYTVCIDTVPALFYQVVVFAWVYRISEQSLGGIISYGDSPWVLADGGSGTVKWYGRLASWVNVSAAVPNSEWHSVAGTYDKAAGTYNWRIYVDGVVVDSTTVIGNLSPHAGYDYQLQVGGYQATLNWHGYIDEPRVYAIGGSNAQMDSLVSNLHNYNSISGACAAAPVGGAKIRGAYIDGKLQTWRTQ